MANVLTGDYEAALQIAVRQINGLLGTLHQNGAVPGAALMTPHSTTGRIGDPRRRPPDVSVFEDWVVEFQRASPGGGLRDIQSELIAAAPPGAARMLTDAFAALRATFPNRHPPPFPPPDVVRGMVKLQTSSPTITVSAGSSSEITVHANIRAQYYPDPGTTDLPAPIHGEVHAAFEVRRTQTGSGTRLLISPSPQDAKIQFTAAPGSGLSAGQANALAVQVRKVLREQMVLLPVDLPPGFPFAVFKGLGSGASQAIALPFQLSGAQAPASGVQPLTQSFIGASGFALAVRSDYVSGLIDLEAIRRAVDSRTITLTLRGPFGVGSVSVTYRLRFTTGPTLTFKSGGIEIAGRVAVETSTWWAPNGFVSFKQMISLMLDTRQQTVTPVRAGDPSVDQSWFIPHDRAVEIVRSQVDSALSTNAASVRRVFDDAGSAFGNALSTFDPSALVSFTGVEITPDGVIVRGDIHSVARRAPVVHVAETHQSTAFTAFDSWMPAGRIDRFIWSWVEHPALHPVGRHRKIQHRGTPLHLSQAGGRYPARADLPADPGHAKILERGGNQC